MTGMTDLTEILRSLQPKLVEGEFVFLSLPSQVYGAGSQLEPIAAVVEQEGLTLIVPRKKADQQGEGYHMVFRMITLQVNSSLEAVGLTAAVAETLTKKNINANVVAGFHHDHVFVSAALAHEALEALEMLSQSTA